MKGVLTITVRELRRLGRCVQCQEKHKNQPSDLCNECREQSDAAAAEAE